MSNTLKHKFTSAIPDDPSAALVRPSNWNDEHIFAGGAAGKILRWEGANSDKIKFDAVYEQVATASIPTPGTTGRVLSLSDGTKADYYDNGALFVPHGPQVDVVRFATSGAGTKASPWAGWTSIFDTTTDRDYHFCSGWFTFSTTLDIPQRCRLQGTGIEITNLKYTGAGVGIQINGVAETDPKFDSRVTLQDFSLRSASGTKGIQIINSAETYLKNVYIRGQVTNGDPVTGWSTAGLFYGATFPSSFVILSQAHQVRVEVCAGVGLRIGDGTYASNGNILLAFHQCRFQGNGSYGVYSDRVCRNLSFIGCDIEGNTTADFWIDAPQSLTVNNCYFESVSTYRPMILGGGSAAGVFGGISITGCFFSAPGAISSLLEVARSTHVLTGVTVKDCVFNASAATAYISVGAVESGYFGANAFSEINAVVTHYSTASPASSMLGVEINDGVATFGATADARCLSVRRYSNTLNDQATIQFEDLTQIRAKISSLIANTGNNLGQLRFDIGDGSVLRTIMRLNGADANILQLQRFVNGAGDKVTIEFNDLNQIRARLYSKIQNTGNDRGAIGIDVGVGTGGGTLRQVAQFDDTATAGDTAMLLYDVDNATLERVTVGVADSGGVGFKVLRIPN